MTLNQRSQTIASKLKPVKILVLNSGSSSIKYQVFDMDDESVLASGTIERIGEVQGLARHRCRTASGELTEFERERPFADHRQGLQHLFAVLGESAVIRDASELAGVGHRVAHGGEAFRKPAMIDDAVVDAITAMIPLAPLHNPANLLGIEVAREECTGTAQVAVFDTAFHHSLPPVAYHYALPYDLYREHSIRRYGFHGTSHGYVAKTLSQYLDRPLHELNLITLHLGNGASITAIRQGKSIDTSMGLTPLEGLIMGTRSGDLDPSIVFYLQKICSMDSEAVEKLLNHDSGLKGLCGRIDMREIHHAAERGDPRARLAIDLFCYRIKKYIGAYLAVLGNVDALVFTGGIGENDAQIRLQICAGLEQLGFCLDPALNAASFHGTQAIHGPNSQSQLYVIPTDEELEIARQTMDCIRGN